MFCKMGALKNFAIFTIKRLWKGFFVIEFQIKSFFLKKETPVQVFSSEFYEIFLNMFFIEQQWRAEKSLFAC